MRHTLLFGCPRLVPPRSTAAIGASHVWPPAHLHLFYVTQAVCERLRVHLATHLHDVREVAVVDCMVAVAR